MLNSRNPLVRHSKYPEIIGGKKIHLSKNKMNWKIRKWRIQRLQSGKVNLRK